MEEIAFSVFDHGKEAPDNMQALLRQFEQEQGIRVRLEIIPWTSGWSRMVEVALYHHGPDVSEIGNTWGPDLARMEALRPFEHDEINKIIGEEHFFESVWDGVVKTRDKISKVYSIPWSADVRVVFYRRDLLTKAGVDEAIAFKDTDQFDRTLAVLKAKHISMPLALPTQRSNLTIHNLASWVWSAGGAFLSPDNLYPIFDQPQALEGFKAYFRLSRYLDAAARNLGELEADQMFWSGQAAVILSGYWILHIKTITEEVRRNIGIMPMPGVPFVGGNQLIIWNHSRHVGAVLKFIQFLQSESAGRLIYPQFGLPVRSSAWVHPPFDAEHYQTLMRAIQKGRGFPTGQLWGLVEKRLTDVFTDIWTEVQREPEARLDTIVETHLINLARRLQMSLGS
jgi:multiple sugar transport system substrate-binding protein